MASDNPPTAKIELSDSGITVPSDSENYSAHHETLSASTTTSSSPLVLYKPPSFWSVLRGAAINLVLPFVNGLMLGFGELFAHETAFRLGWSNTKVGALFTWNTCETLRAVFAGTDDYRSSLPTEGHNLSAPGSKCENFRRRGGETRALACGIC